MPDTYEENNYVAIWLEGETVLADPPISLGEDLNEVPSYSPATGEVNTFKRYENRQTAAEEILSLNPDWVDRYSR